MRARLPYVVLGLSVGLVFNVVVAMAWSGPSASAPNGNVSAPINVGTTAQIKNGDLGINNISAFGNALLSGLGVGTGRYLNFDYTSGGTSGTGSSGYGIRDNAGTLEFKNRGGVWQSLQVIVCALTSCSSGGPVAFGVHKNNTNQSVGSGVTTSLTWEAEVFDTNNNFSSNRFTPTVAGKYLINLSVFCGGGFVYQCEAIIRKNGVAIAVGNQYEYPVHSNNNSVTFVSTIVDMNGSTDYIDAAAWHNGGTAVYGDTIFTFFNGSIMR